MKSLIKLKSVRGRISVEVGAYEEEAGGGVEQRGGLVRVHCNESGEDRIQARPTYQVHHRLCLSLIYLNLKGRIF